MKVITAEEEYQKDKDLKPEDVKNLLNWVKLQPHLPEISESEIILFLQSCYFRAEPAKLTIDNYYTSRTHYTELFHNRDPKNEIFRKALDVAVFQPLPGTTPEGYRVIYVKLTDGDVSKFNYAQQAKIFFMSIDLWLAQEGTALGHVIVMDMRGIALGHLPKITLGTLKKAFFYLQECLPFRLKGIHYIEAVPFMDKLMSLFKPFMKKELLEVIQIHTPENRSNLFKCIPKDILPKECGGNGPTIKQLHDKMKQNLIENREYFLEMDKIQRVDEKKRHTKTANSDEIAGSFKKLDID